MKKYTVHLRKGQFDRVSQKEEPPAPFSRLLTIAKYSQIDEYVIHKYINIENFQAEKFRKNDCGRTTFWQIVFA